MDIHCVYLTNFHFCKLFTITFTGYSFRISHNFDLNVNGYSLRISRECLLNPNSFEFAYLSIGLEIDVFEFSIINVSFAAFFQHQYI